MIKSIEDNQQTMMCRDYLGRIWKTPVFGNPSKEEKFKQELAFKKYIFNEIIYDNHTR